MLSLYSCAASTLTPVQMSSNQKWKSVWALKPKCGYGYFSFSWGAGRNVSQASPYKYTPSDTFSNLWREICHLQLRLTRDPVPAPRLKAIVVTPNSQQLIEGHPATSMTHLPFHVYNLLRQGRVEMSQLYHNRRLLGCRKQRHSRGHIPRFWARQPGLSRTHTPAGSVHGTLNTTHDSLVERREKINVL